MTDNTQLNANTTSGDIISTEVLPDSSKAQRIKIIIGAQHADGGDVSITNPMPVSTTDNAGVISRIATDDSVSLLRRLTDICEPLATQDSANRQKITIDAISANLTLSTVTTVGTVTAVTTVSTVTTVGTVTTVSTVTTVGTVTNISQLGTYPIQWNLIDQARNAYANGIRRNLAFS